MQKEWDRAIEDLTRAIELDPTSVAAFSTRGAARASRAEVVPPAITDFATRAYARARQAEFDAAIADLTEALRRDPKHVNSLYNRAVIRIKRDEWDLAEADMKRVLELQPGHLGAASALAEADTRKKQAEVRSGWESVLSGGYTGLPGVGQASATPPEVAIDTPDQIYHRGLGYVEKGEWAAALLRG